MDAEFRFTVTADHIAGARQGDMNRCAVADALVSRGYKKPSVGGAGISFDREGERWVCRNVPAAIMRFVADFDKDRKSVAPTTFVITARKIGGD